MVNDSYENLDFQSANVLAQVRAEQEHDQKPDQNAKPDQTDSKKKELRNEITKLKEECATLSDEGIYLKNVMRDACEELLANNIFDVIDKDDTPNVVRLIKEAGVDIPMEYKTVTVDVSLSLTVEIEVELPVTLSEHDDVTDYIDDRLAEAIEDAVREGAYNNDNYDVTDVS